MTQHSEPLADHLSSEARVVLQGPRELADALPYFLGFHPDDSIVLVALHDNHCGGRVRLGIPTDPADWSKVAEQLAVGLSKTTFRAARPDGALVYLCQDPVPGDTGRAVMERLKPLAQRLRISCGEREMPVHEALCLSGGRYWSYSCPDARCCSQQGHPMGFPGTSAIAAAAVYAGVQVRGSLKEMEARFTPVGPPLAALQEKALDAAAMTLTPRMLGGVEREGVLAETIGLVERLVDRFGKAVEVPKPEQPRPATTGWGSPVGGAAQDSRDDALVDPEEAASLIIGLQNRNARDRVAEWMEGDAAQPALRLWRALARRCVGAYEEHAVAPLTLAGWVAWSAGDEPAARVAFHRALRADPHYLFAQLLHQACNQGLDPEVMRCHMREARTRRAWTTAEDSS